MREAVELDCDHEEADTRLLLNASMLQRIMAGS